MKIKLSDKVVQSRITDCLAGALEATTEQEEKNCIKYALIYMQLEPKEKGDE